MVSQSVQAVATKFAAKISDLDQHFYCFCSVPATTDFPPIKCAMPKQKRRERRKVWGERLTKKAVPFLITQMDPVVAARERERVRRPAYCPSRRARRPSVTAPLSFFRSVKSAKEGVAQFRKWPNPLCAFSVSNEIRNSDNIVPDKVDGIISHVHLVVYSSRHFETTASVRARPSATAHFPFAALSPVLHHEHCLPRPPPSPRPPACSSFPLSDG